MFVYKHLKEEYFELFRKEGILRIGNIEMYREIENEKIKDPHEGRTTYRIFTENEPVYITAEQVNAITNDYHMKANLNVAKHSFFESDLIVPNAFVFSTSLKSDMVFSDCGYNSCYEIRNVKQFAEMIGIELNKQIPLIMSVTQKVMYVKSKIIMVTNKNKNAVIRTIPYDKSKSNQIKQIHVEDYFTKPIAFEKEEEFRFMYIPKDTIGKEPIFIKNQGLVAYCEF